MLRTDLKNGMRQQEVNTVDCLEVCEKVKINYIVFKIFDIKSSRYPCKIKYQCKTDETVLYPVRPIHSQQCCGQNAKKCQATSNISARKLSRSRCQIPLRKNNCFVYKLIMAEINRSTLM
jgi:hypothetical protein